MIQNKIFKKHSFFVELFIASVFFGVIFLIMIIPCILPRPSSEDLLKKYFRTTLKDGYKEEFCYYQKNPLTTWIYLVYSTEKSSEAVFSDFTGVYELKKEDGVKRLFEFYEKDYIPVEYKVNYDLEYYYNDYMLYSISQNYLFFGYVS